MGENQRADEKVHEEQDGLEHERALAGGEVEAFAEVADGSAPKGDAHEGGDCEVEDGGVEAVVEGLGPDEVDAVEV